MKRSRTLDNNTFKKRVCTNVNRYSSYEIFGFYNPHNGKLSADACLKVALRNKKEKVLIIDANFLDPVASIIDNKVDVCPESMSMLLLTHSTSGINHMFGTSNISLLKCGINFELFEDLLGGEYFDQALYGFFRNIAIKAITEFDIAKVFINLPPGYSKIHRIALSACKYVVPVLDADDVNAKFIMQFKKITTLIETERNALLQKISCDLFKPYQHSHCIDTAVLYRSQHSGDFMAFLEFKGFKHIITLS